MKLRKDFKNLSARYEALKQEYAELEAQLQKKKIEDVNKITNKPSSKQAEWEDKKTTSDLKAANSKKPSRKKKQEKAREIKQNPGNQKRQKKLKSTFVKHAEKA